MGTKKWYRLEIAILEGMVYDHHDNKGARRVGKLGDGAEVYRVVWLTGWLEVLQTSAVAKKLLFMKYKYSPVKRRDLWLRYNNYLKGSPRFLYHIHQAN